MCSARVVAIDLRPLWILCILNEKIESREREREKLK